MSLFRKTVPAAPLPAPTSTGPAISLAKVEQAAPDLVSLTKAAAVSLEKRGLTGQRAAVYLVLDHSGSMSSHYAEGSVQRLADQALGLSANLDDDGIVPVVFFGSTASPAMEVRLADHVGVVERLHQQQQWGSTNYVAAMDAVAEHHQASGATGPALVIFQTDGAPDSQPDAERVLREYSKLPIFWAFVGFGPRVDFLARLDRLRGRTVDNASFFHASRPAAVTDEALYDGITGEYASWLAAAAAAGVLR
jgi:vWA found in TerF C terminus